MSDLETQKQILKDRNIKVDKLEQDKPLLLSRILIAMNDFAELYYIQKKRIESLKTDSKALLINSVVERLDIKIAKLEESTKVEGFEDPNELDKAMNRLRDLKILKGLIKYL